MASREEVRLKFGGLCAYSGTPLQPDWQVDHAVPRRLVKFGVISKEESEDISNLYPCQRIINHYKRSKSINGFRELLSTLHLRLRRLPKNPRVQRSIRHKEYLLEVAELFGITPDKPFSGKFYFEKIK